MVEPRRKALRLEQQLDALAARPFAHRGLHTPGGPVENSIAAFDAAIAKGLGIELDIRLTSDGTAVVFHDEELDRLTGESGRVAERSARALSQIKLTGTEQGIMALQDVLLHIGGRVPLLIEAKCGKGQNPEAVAMAVRRAMEGYVGPLGVMSFHPTIPSWFASHFPGILNGLVMTEESGKDIASWRTSGPARLLTMKRSGAKFLAYDIRSFPSKLVEHFRTPKTRVFTWTVRTADEVATARAHTDQMIVEGEAVALCQQEDNGPTI